METQLPSFRIFQAPDITLPMCFISSASVYEQMKDYGKADREVMLLLMLNSKNKVIDIETHSIGAVDSSAVYPKEVMRSCVIKGCSSLILLHNHPSGDTAPSIQDISITKALCFCCIIFGLKLLDHIILGKGCYYSFADEGRIGEIELEMNNLKMQAGI